MRFINGGTRLKILGSIVVGCAVLAGTAVSQASNGQNIYAVSGTLPSVLYNVNVLPSGTDTVIGPVTGAFTQLDIAATSAHPSGTLYGIDATALYTIDGATGAATVVAPLTPPTFINALAFDKDGNLYGASGNNIYTINTQTGAVILVGAMGSGFGSSGDIAFAPNGALYGSVFAPLSANNVLVQINPATGAATRVLPKAKNGSTDLGSPNVFGLAFVGGKLYGLTNSAPAGHPECAGGAVLRIDTNSSSKAGSAEFERCLSFNTNGGAS